MTLPAEPYLADPADLAVWLDTDADDPKLLAALRAASRRFVGAVRHPVRLIADDTVIRYGDGTDTLTLPAAPIVDVTLVEVDGIAVTDYRPRRDAGVLWRTGGACWPRQAEVAVTYSHGHDPIPEEISEAVLDQARTLHAVRPGIQTIQAGGESVTYGVQAAVGVTSQWTAAVEAYRLNRGDRP